MSKVLVCPASNSLGPHLFEPANHSLKEWDSQTFHGFTKPLIYRFKTRLFCWETLPKMGRTNLSHNRRIPTARAHTSWACRRGSPEQSPWKSNRTCGCWISVAPEIRLRWFLEPFCTFEAHTDPCRVGPNRWWPGRAMRSRFARQAKAKDTLRIVVSRMTCFGSCGCLHCHFFCMALLFYTDRPSKGFSHLVPLCGV